MSHLNDIGVLNYFQPVKILMDLEISFLLLLVVELYLVCVEIILQYKMTAYLFDILGIPIIKR